MANPAPGWEKHPNHRVDITPHDGTVTVRAGDVVIAQSTEAYQVAESRHDTCWYLPIGDVDTKNLTDSETQTYCPFKGYASYKHIGASDTLIEDALWIYADPFDECLTLKGYASFYTSKVDVQVA
ncbi:MAG: hypothetical protein ACI9ON_001879 [Limisphaerales bacterium]|jgi:uncharacterized protein (DUF427 family)